MSHTIKSTWKWICRNTKITNDHMTPEIKLRLITSACPMWMQHPDNCPYLDPYWAFYWPGGQSLARFVLDNGEIVRGKTCLDFGSGCGAVGISAAARGATKVIFNDIDETALVASCCNRKLNNIHLNSLQFDTTNFVASHHHSEPNCDVILIGDMFYDYEFAKVLLNRLTNWSKNGKKIYIGDPGRHALPSCFTEIAEYPLPSYVTREHYGFSTGKIFTLNIN